MNELTWIITDYGLVNRALLKSGNYGTIPPDAKQIEFCRKWLRQQFQKRAYFNTGSGMGSYSLKHRAEEAWRVEKGVGYISNGALIYAAWLEGYKVRHDGGPGPNAIFDIEYRKEPQ